MHQFVRSEQIEALPEAVFDFVTDQKWLHSWSPEVLESEPTDGGPIKVGTVLRQRRVTGNHERVDQVEVTAHERPLRHAVHSRVLGVDLSVTFTFEPAGAKATRVKLACEMQGHGLGRLFEGMVAREVEATDDQRLAELRTAMGLAPTQVPAA